MALYGSLQNRLLERETQTIPEIGMGATELGYSDRRPYTIIEILSSNKVVVQEDNWESSDNVDMSNNWKYSPDPEGNTLTLIKTKKGWKVLKGSTYFRLNHREYYYDYSF